MKFRPAYKTTIVYLALFLFLTCRLFAQNTATVINNNSGLYPVTVNAVLRPTTTADIVTAVKNSKGPVSIGGGRYSMGGQTATEGAVQIDMRGFDKVLHFSKQDKEITVQAGITWRQVLKYIDTADLSVRVMQSYANFTVGGSLSVNIHGRYIGEGPIIASVKSFKIVLANGDVVDASPAQNSSIFYGAIGGYGALGVITEVTLILTVNEKVERIDTVMDAHAYKRFFFDRISNNPAVVFHNGDIYPNRYNKIRAVTFVRTSNPVTIKPRLNQLKDSYWFNRFIYGIVSEHPFGKWTRQHVIDPIIYSKSPVSWRNYEAASNAEELEPRNRKKNTYVLQEYFVPVENFESFQRSMVTILKSNRVNVINISVRNTQADPGSLMAWARTQVFSFVIYYKQGTAEADKKKVETWTRQLIDVAISNNGTYYLPYQIHATSTQFAKAYPNAAQFFKLKKQLDPTNKFRNKLWDAYYQ